MEILNELVASGVRGVENAQENENQICDDVVVGVMENDWVVFVGDHDSGPYHHDVLEGWRFAAFRDNYGSCRRLWIAKKGVVAGAYHLVVSGPPPYPFCAGLPPSASTSRFPCDRLPAFLAELCTSVGLPPLFVPSQTVQPEYRGQH